MGERTARIVRDMANVMRSGDPGWIETLQTITPSLLEPRTAVTISLRAKNLSEQERKRAVTDFTNSVAVYQLGLMCRIRNHNSLVARYNPSEVVNADSYLKSLIIDLKPLHPARLDECFALFWELVAQQYGDLPALRNVHLLKGLPHDLNSIIPEDEWDKVCLQHMLKEQGRSEAAAWEANRKAASHFQHTVKRYLKKAVERVLRAPQDFPALKIFMGDFARRVQNKPQKRTNKKPR